MAAIELSKEHAALLRSCMMRENSRYLKGNKRFPFHRVLCYNQELQTGGMRLWYGRVLTKMRCVS